MGALNLLATDVLSRINGKRVYFDTAPIVYALENNPQFARHSIPFLEASENREILGFASALSLMEVLVKPMRDGNVAMVERLKDIFRSGDLFEFVGHTDEVFVSAAQLRASSKLKSIDALHLATALSFGCDFFVTNDLAFDSSASTAAIEVVQIGTLA